MGTIGDGTGSSYPGALDQTETRADGDVITADFQNDIQAVAVATQPVLGTNPQGAHASVVVRLDAVDAKLPMLNLVNSDTRTASGPVSTYETLHTDPVPAGTLSAVRALEFFYTGEFETVSGTNELRITLDSTPIATVSAANIARYVIHGRLFYRIAGNLSFISFQFSTPDFNSSSVVFNSVAFDATNAFNFVLEGQRSDAGNNLSVIGSQVYILG